MLSGRDNVPWEIVFAESFGDVPEGAVALKAARQRARKTQVSLAAAAEVTRPDIANMEMGKKPIGKDIAKRLAVVLKTDYRVFFVTLASKT